jgi:glycosyltransferase involved in cell wall biosynthesis
LIRVGINALYLIPGGVGGTEIYLRNVLGALAQVDGENQYFVFRNRDTGADLTPQAPNFHDCPQRVSGRSRPQRLLYEQFALPVVCSRRGIDVLFNGGFTAPLLCRCPMVTVFHDLQYLRHPEFFRWWDLPFWRVMLPASARRSQRIVVLSQAVKADLVHFYRLPPERIAVSPHGIEPEFARIAARRAVEAPLAKLILSISTLHPHKNLGALLTAFQHFRAKHGGWTLCLAGLKGFEAEKIEARRQELGLNDSVTITGWIPRAELYGLFATAAAFIYPSRFEGFGIPVLEALAAGIPAACSQLPSLIEIAQGTVRFFDPNQVDDIAAALENITTPSDEREQRRQAGIRRAQNFSWERSARALIEALTEAAYPATRSKKSHD